MDEKMKKQYIQRLDINDKVIGILTSNNITTLGELCKKSKTDLKKLNLTQKEVEKIEIELELLALNLKTGNN